MWPVEGSIVDLRSEKSPRATLRVSSDGRDKGKSFDFLDTHGLIYFPFYQKRNEMQYEKGERSESLTDKRERLDKPDSTCGAR